MIKLVQVKKSQIEISNPVRQVFVTKYKNVCIRVDVLNVYSFYYVIKEGINIMKLMISQPMRGKTNEQIREERAELVSGLQEEGNEVIDTVFENAPADEDIAIYMLSQSIRYIGKVDGIVFMKGWEKARGCKIEHEVAVEYGKQVFYEN
mgnify:CR=1 FL=1